MFDPKKQHFVPLVENVEISKSDLDRLLDRLGTDISSISMPDPQIYRTLMAVDQVDSPVVIKIFNSSKANISASDICYVDFTIAWSSIKPSEHSVPYYKQKIQNYLDDINTRQE